VGLGVNDVANRPEFGGFSGPLFSAGGQHGGIDNHDAFSEDDKAAVADAYLALDIDIIGDFFQVIPPVLLDEKVILHPTIYYLL
jgi:hypothetical protein